MGGVTAGQFCSEDRRCRAGLNLDGIPQYGTMIDHSLGRPFLMVYSARPGRTGASDAIYRRGASPYIRVDVRDTLHLDFSDMVLWGGPLRERPILGKLAPERIVEITRAIVRGFFDQELLGRKLEAAGGKAGLSGGHRPPHPAGRPLNRSERTQESQQRRPILGLQLPEALPGSLRFAAVPEDRLLGVTGAAVVEEAHLAADGFEEAEAPERGRAPFAAGGGGVRPAVGEAVPQVVQEEVGVGVEDLARELGHVRGLPGPEGRMVAGGAAGAREERLAPEDGRVGPVAAGGYGKKADVERRARELVLGELRDAPAVPVLAAAARHSFCRGAQFVSG